MSEREKFLKWERDIKQFRESEEGVYRKTFPKKFLVWKDELKKQKELKRKEELTIKRISINYTFLQYYKLVMRWAVVSSGIPRYQLEFLLYLHPIGVFSGMEYERFLRIFQIRDYGMFDDFIEKGFICLSNKIEGQHYYSFTENGNRFIGQIYKKLLALEPFAEGEAPRQIKFPKTKQDEKRNNLLKAFNKRVRDKQDEK